MPTSPSRRVRARCARTPRTSRGSTFAQTSATRSRRRARRRCPTRSAGTPAAARRVRAATACAPASRIRSHVILLRRGVAANDRDERHIGTRLGGGAGDQHDLRRQWCRLMPAIYRRSRPGRAGPRQPGAGPADGPGWCPARRTRRRGRRVPGRPRTTCARLPSPAGRSAGPVAVGDPGPHTRAERRSAAQRAGRPVSRSQPSSALFGCQASPNRAARRSAAGRSRPPRSAGRPGGPVATSR